MTAFHLDTLWHDSGAMELVLTNLSEDTLHAPELYYGSITRTQLPSRAEGGRLVRRQANYHEYAAPADLQLPPGGQWRLVEHSLTRQALHANEGPKSAALRHGGGPWQGVSVADLQAPGAGADQGTAKGLRCGVVPEPQAVRIDSYLATTPAHLRIAGDLALLRAAAKVSALTRRLHPLLPTPFVLAGGDGLRAVRAAAGDLPVDGYHIRFARDQIAITHGAGQGLFYALITLAQIQAQAHQAPQHFAVPLQGEIRDAPRHGWRGAHLDVSRQFYPLEQVLRYIDILAWHKMNRFHWHLTDDEGWRLEIKALPALTEVAAATGPDLPILPQLGGDPAGQRGFYSQAEAKEVITHAASLGLAVMPEIDLPGHCACVLGAYPDLADPEEAAESYQSVQGFANNALNPAMEGAYRFAETVLAEVCDLFPFEVVHVGGDEVAEAAWMQSPKAKAMLRETGMRGTFDLQAHFLRHLQGFLAARGKKIGGWEELALGEGVGRDNCLLFAWTTVEKAAELAAAGYDVVATPGQAYYLDMAQSEDWYEPGASWAGVTPLAQTYGFEALNGSEALAAHLQGVQGCVWSEHLTTRARVNHQVFPRLSAIAEAGWTAPERKDLDRFATVAGWLPRL